MSTSQPSMPDELFAKYLEGIHEAVAWHTIAIVMDRPGTTFAGTASGIAVRRAGRNLLITAAHIRAATEMPQMNEQ